MGDVNPSSSSDDPMKGKGKSPKGGDGSAKQANHPWLWGWGSPKKQPVSRESPTEQPEQLVFPKMEISGSMQGNKSSASTEVNPGSSHPPTDEIPGSSNAPRPRSGAASGTDHILISSENASQYLPDTKPHQGEGQGEDQGSPALDLLRKLNKQPTEGTATAPTKAREQEPPSSSQDFVFPTVDVQGPVKGKNKT